KAPSFWCKHRIAAGLAKRARTLAKAKLEQLQSHGTSNGTTQPATAQPQVQAEPATPPGEAPVEAEPVTPSVELPTQSAQAVAPTTHSEAPVSLNCHLMLEGRQVQVTLRGTDESVVLHRLITLLQQYPVAQPPTEPPTQGTGSAVPDDNPFCHIHKVPL